MAAELISEVLKAEAAAKEEEAKTETKITELLEYAQKKAAEINEQTIADAKRRAGAMITSAEEKAEEYMSQAENLAKIKKKSVIRSTQPLYDEAIEAIIDFLLK